MDLLERDAQLGALQEYAAEAAAGAGRLVLVAGEAGVGKSTLVEALERRVPGARWAWGACDPLTTPRPLGALVDLAPQLDPELDRMCRDGAPRERLFDAAREALAGGGAPTCAVFEDVHWADDATLDLLRFLGRRATSRGHVCSRCSPSSARCAPPGASTCLRCRRTRSTRSPPGGASTAASCSARPAATRSS